MLKIKDWYSLRGMKFIRQRGEQLLKGYNLTPDKAMHRIERCIETLARYGCVPTLFTPGVIVQRYPQFIKHLRDQGAEIAVHGNQHVNLNDYPIVNAKDQLERAVRTFDSFGIEAHGFRCPYVGCSDELLDSLPEGLFSYSSNRTIRWELPPEVVSSNGYKYFDILNNIYNPNDASDMVCVPSNYSNLVEIPVCTPDDLQQYYGLNAGTAGIIQTWKHILNQTHHRGELFTLIFHTELANVCEQPFIEILNEARELHPPVWVACLRDISAWWLEKSKFRVDVDPSSNGLHLSFNCSPRATILTRGLGHLDSENIWNGTYYRLPNEEVEVPAEPRPFVGLQDSTPERVLSFLQDQGYILDTGDTASKCGIFLDSSILARMTSQVQLIDYIEASTAPLVRYWRWPDGAKSALSITGDLDALSLLDYSFRLVGR